MLRWASFVILFVVLLDVLFFAHDYSISVRSTSCFDGCITFASTRVFFWVMALFLLSSDFCGCGFSHMVLRHIAVLFAFVIWVRLLYSAFFSDSSSFRAPLLLPLCRAAFSFSFSLLFYALSFLRFFFGVRNSDSLWSTPCSCGYTPLWRGFFAVTPFFFSLSSAVSPLYAPSLFRVSYFTFDASVTLTCIRLHLFSILLYFPLVQRCHIFYAVAISRASTLLYQRRTSMREIVETCLYSLRFFLLDPSFEPKLGLTNVFPQQVQLATVD